MNRNRVRAVVLAGTIVAMLGAADLFAASGWGMGAMTTMNDLCIGGPLGTVACKANWGLTGSCTMVPDPCGAGVLPATACACEDVTQFGAPPGCACIAEMS